MSDAASPGGAQPTVLCVVGARPNFMKIAPLMRAFAGSDRLTAVLVHTGQHYDEAMKDAFFGQLGIPEPAVDLGVGSGSHAAQTAEVMRRFEPVLLAHAPAAVLVVGDVNSTLACALVAAKCRIPVMHVEAGLRSFDRSMPEEINRVLTDQLSTLLFTTERGAHDNLVREGVAPERILFVGNVMIDTLLSQRALAPAPTAVLAGLGVDAAIAAAPGGYGLVTLHRPANVDDPVVLADLLDSLSRLAARLPLLLPLHPRTRERLTRYGLLTAAAEACTLLPPLRYRDMLGLMTGARLVLTDSGGVQEETTALGVPCLTLRENTERPVTVELGTNTVVGRNRDRILTVADDVLTTGGKAGRVPELWDGHAAERITQALVSWLHDQARVRPADQPPPAGGPT